MKCKNCGAENLENQEVCSECGKDPKVLPKMEAKQCKHLFGVLFAFLSVIGLGIGLYMFKPHTWERRTFLGAWVMTTILIVFFGGIIFGWSLACNGCINYFNLDCK